MTVEELSEALKRTRAKRIKFFENKRNFDVECYLILLGLHFEINPARMPYTNDMTAFNYEVIVKWNIQ